jgi:hypothetical protein
MTSVRLVYQLLGDKNHDNAAEHAITKYVQVLPMQRIQTLGWNRTMMEGCQMNWLVGNVGAFGYQ